MSRKVDELAEKVAVLEATVETLVNEVEQKFSEGEVLDMGINDIFVWGVPHKHKKVHWLTLKGKVDAIIKHLNIDIAVEQQKTTGPTAKVTEIKKPKAKK